MQAYSLAGVSLALRDLAQRTIITQYEMNDQWKTFLDKT